MLENTINTVKSKEIKLIELDNINYIGNFIYEYRVSQNITQEELAIKSELKQPQISRLEKSKNVKLTTLYKVLKALNLELVSTDLPLQYFNSNRDNVTIGEMIVYKRKSIRMTQQELALKTNLKQPQIVHIERNTDVTLDTLSKIIDTLNIKLNIVKRV